MMQHAQLALSWCDEWTGSKMWLEVILKMY